jgi:hypothetical protein
MLAAVRRKNASNVTSVSYTTQISAAQSGMSKQEAGGHLFYMCVTTCWWGGALPVLYSGDYNEFGQSANSALVLGLA